jgi:hypothetical protein
MRTVGLFTKRPPTFSGAVSKRQFVQEWVIGVLDEAGCDHARADEMADTAANGIVRQSLKAVGEAYQDYGVVTYLDGLDETKLSWRADEIYNAVIELATAGRPGPILRERISAFDRKLDETFTSIRPNYVEYAKTNYTR